MTRFFCAISFVIFTVCSATRLFLRDHHATTTHHNFRRKRATESPVVLRGSPAEHRQGHFVRERQDLSGRAGRGSRKVPAVLLQNRRRKGALYALAARRADGRKQMLRTKGGLQGNELRRHRRGEHAPRTRRDSFSQLAAKTRRVHKGKQAGRRKVGIRRKGKVPAREEKLVAADEKQSDDFMQLVSRTRRVAKKKQALRGKEGLSEKPLAEFEEDLHERLHGDRSDSSAKDTSFSAKDALSDDFTQLATSIHHVRLAGVWQDLAGTARWGWSKLTQAMWDALPPYK